MKYIDPKTKKKDAMHQEAMKIGAMARKAHKQMKGIGSASKASGASVGKRPKHIKMHDIMGRGLKKKK